MKLKTALTALAIAAMSIASAPASWANTLPFQGVTFSLTDEGSSTLRLTIDNALTGGNGNWTDINFIDAFMIKNTGVSGVSVVGDADWIASPNQLNGQGTGTIPCDGGASTGFCFYRDTPPGPLALTDHMVFDIAYTSGSLDLTLPHLQVFFMETADQCKVHQGVCNIDATGSLLSKDIPPGTVPEPASLLLLGAGLAGIGLSQWKRRKAGQA